MSATDRLAECKPHNWTGEGKCPECAEIDALFDYPKSEPRQSDPNLVICPACVHEFRAVPENIQDELLALREGMRDICEALGRDPEGDWFNLDGDIRALADRATQAERALEEIRGQKPVAWQNINKPDEMLTNEQLDPEWKSEFRPLFTASSPVEVIDPYVMDLVREHGATMTNGEIVRKFLPKRQLSNLAELDKTLRYIATFTVGKVHAIATAVCCGKSLEWAREEYKDATFPDAIYPAKCAKGEG